MNLTDLQNKLNKIANSPEKIQKALFLGVKSVQAEMTPRIFQDGQAVNGAIDPYTTGELWVSDKGKNKKGLTHKGKPHKLKSGEIVTREGLKTTYFENYGEFKSAQVGTSKPNMFLTGDLKNDFNNAPVISADFNSVKITVSQLSKDKIDGRYDKTNQNIFKLKPSEIETLKRTIVFEIRKEVLNA